MANIESLSSQALEFSQPLEQIHAPSPIIH